MSAQWQDQLGDGGQINRAPIPADSQTTGFEI
jgi:hypothetical protein